MQSDPQSLLVSKQPVFTTASLESIITITYVTVNGVPVARMRPSLDFGVECNSFKYIGLF